VVYYRINQGEGRITMNELGVPRVKKMAHTLKVSVNVLFWILVGGAIVALAIGVFFTFLAEQFPWLQRLGSGGGLVLSADDMIRYHVDEWAPGVSLVPVYRAIAFAGSVGAVALSIIMKKLASLLATIERDQPFAEENSKHLQVMGIVLLIGSLGFRALSAIVANSVINTLNLTNLSVNISVDIYMAVSGFLLLILSGVFEYGNYLQQEYEFFR